LAATLLVAVSGGPGGVAAAAASASPGQLDPGFGSGGTVLTAIGAANAAANAVAVQPDGRIVAAGQVRSGTGPVANDDFAVARYNPDGGLDTSFGVGGVAVTPLTAGNDAANDVAVQPDGMIVAVGRVASATAPAESDFGLVRYRPDGALDPGFGGTGTVTTVFSEAINGPQAAHGNAVARAVAVQPVNGSFALVVGGDYVVPDQFGGTVQFSAVVRYNPDGSLDQSFGDGGRATVPGATLADLAIQPDGSIVTVGTRPSGQATQFNLSRYIADSGALDPGFGSGGSLAVKLNTLDLASAVAVQADGRIVFAGSAVVSGNYDFAVLRATTEGALDPTFSGNGHVTTPVGAGRDLASDLAVQANGRIVVAGRTSVGALDRFAVVRYDSDGSLDTSFSGTGRAVVPIGPKPNFASDVPFPAAALQADGAIVLAGAGLNGANEDFALARLTGDPVPRAGYWLVASDGGIFSFGDAAFAGSTGAMPLNRPVVGMAATPSGHGYWLVASDGGIFSFGEAAFAGSTGGMPLNRPVVGMAATPSGHGYWLVASDGGIFSFGDAAFAGSAGGMPLNRPVVGMAATPSGHGYWLVASDGGIFSFGDAAFAGSTGGMPLNRPVVGMAATPSGHGYWLVASDGGIFSFGDAVFAGSTGGMPLNRPVVGMAATGS